MLHFVIPLRSAQTTKDWRAIQHLLQNTVNSVDNQTCRDFRCAIVCHEPPNDVELPDSCELLEAPFDVPNIDLNAIATEESLFRLHTDKGRKLILGLAQARAENSDFVMFLDADDLVSNRLAQWVAEHPQSNGWYLDEGYRWNHQTPNWLFRRSNFYKECGSSYLLRTDLAPFPPEIDLSKDLDDYYIRRYVVHAYVRENMEKLGHTLQPLPFAGAIYTFNGQNFYALNFRGGENRFKDIGRLLIKGKRISQKLRDEFCIV